MDADESRVLRVIELKFDEFSPSQKKIGQFILDNPDTVPFKTLDDLSADCLVNPSTIVRFCKKIGFDGFPALQKQLQSALMRKLDSLSHPGIARLYGVHETSDDMVEDALRGDLAAMDKFVRELDRTEVLRFVKAVLKARKRYIVATRASTGFAHFLYFRMKKILPDVVFVNDMDGGYYDNIVDIRSEDVVIAISAPRYSALSMNFVKYVHDKKLATILSITNNKVSPLYAMSDIGLCCPSATMPFFRSHVTTMCLINVILSSIFIMNREKSLARMDSFEGMYEDFNLLYKE